MRNKRAVEDIMDIRVVKEMIKTVDKKRMYGVLIIAVVTAAGFSSMTFGKTSHEPGVTRPELPLEVSAATIQPRTVDSIVSAAGTLNSRNISVISSKVMGRVEVTVNEGDHVSQGSLLVKIDSGEIRAQAYQAQAAYNNAKLHHDRIKSLFDEDAATKMEMDQAMLGFESATAGLNAARAMESYTTITAPISGQIMEKHINPGEMAMPGQPLLKIEDNRNLRLEVTLQEQDILSIRPGQAVAVLIDALPGRELRGKVAQIVPAADIRTHSFIVKIDIPENRNLITGMYGRALFSIGRREAIMVPRSAVIEMAGLTGVYRISPDGSAVFQMVQLGDDQGSDVEAITGLKAGDRVIVSKQDTRIDGKKVVVAQK